MPPSKHTPMKKTLSALKAKYERQNTIRLARKTLPDDMSALQNISRFCVFIGQPRSGHSLVGALLNAHPNMVIAHECDIIKYLGKGVDKNVVFSILLNRDRWFSNKIASNWAGYSYAVPNQHQGNFKKLNVIGDKKGGRTATRLYEDPECLTRLAHTVDTPMRIINHIRDPYDSISTEWKKHQEMPSHRDKSLELQIKLFRQRTEAIAQVRTGSLKEYVFDTWHEDFVKDSRQNLKELVSFLGEEASEKYLDDCTSIIFHKPKKSSANAPWTEKLLKELDEMCLEYDFLTRYRR